MTSVLLVTDVSCHKLQIAGTEMMAELWQSVDSQSRIQVFSSPGKHEICIGPDPGLPPWREKNYSDPKLFVSLAWKTWWRNVCREETVYSSLCLLSKQWPKMLNYFSVYETLRKHHLGSKLHLECPVLKTGQDHSNPARLLFSVIVYCTALQL